MLSAKALKLRGAHLVRSTMKLLPSKHEHGRIYQTPRGIFALRSTDTRFISRFHRGLSYGDAEIAQIEALVPTSSHVLFVGSHIGALAIPVSTWARHVTAIEANPETFAFLQTNIILNHRINITAIEIAAGEVDGSIDFLASKANTGGSKRKPIHEDVAYYYDEPKTIRVNMRRLDDVVTDRVDAIVMDIEGSEYFALKGMPRIISEARVMFVEFLPHHLRNVAGVDVKKWHTVIATEFKFLYVPRTNQTAQGEDAFRLLSKMFSENQEEDAIIFSKTPVHIG